MLSFWACALFVSFRCIRRRFFEESSIKYKDFLTEFQVIKAFKMLLKCSDPLFQWHWKHFNGFQGCFEHVVSYNIVASIQNMELTRCTWGCRLSETALESRRSFIIWNKQAFERYDDYRASKIEQITTLWHPFPRSAPYVVRGGQMSSCIKVQSDIYITLFIFFSFLFHWLYQSYIGIVIRA